jgi:HK97 family phage portal protein
MRSNLLGFDAVALRLFKRQSSLTPGTPVGSPGWGTIHTATDGRDILFNSPDGWEQDQPWLWWTGDGEPVFGNPPPGADGSGLLGSLPSVARCTSLICDTIAGMPWQIFRGDYEQLVTPDWILDPQALRPDGRIVDPSTLLEVRLSGVEFWTNWITAALWFGDGYLYVPVRDETGAPKPPLWQLHPYDVQIRDGTYWIKDIPLPVGTVVHLRGRAPYWNGHGRGVISEHGLDLGLAATLRTYSTGVFNTGVPAGYLKSTQPNMTAEQAAALKATWLAQHGGARKSIAVLNATTDFTPISISPVDAQLNAAREWSLRDVALAFGIQPYMLGVPGDSSTYANVESRMIEFKTFTLNPWQRRIESALDAQLPRGTSLKIRTDGLLRADTSTRYAAYQTALTAGFMTVDEVRALENRAPLEPEPGVL